jgi:hypothetical protein
MHRTLAVLAACLLLLSFNDPTWAKKGSSGGSHASHSRSSHSTSSHVSSRRSSSSHASGTNHSTSSRVSSRSSGSHAKTPHTNSRASHSSARKTTRSTTTTASGVQRDKHGKIARSQQAKNEFKKAHPCPSTGKSSGACPGYVIDHVQPLKKGGPDKPSNMQWQTKEAAKAKDKWE